MISPLVTYHLTPVEIWRGQSDSLDYVPEAFGADGFIHCTNGEARVLETGNRYYKGDSRQYCVLTIDVSRVGARIVYEDAAGNFPHIFGRLNRDAVVAAREVVRSDDGAFAGFGNALAPR